MSTPLPDSTDQKVDVFTVPKQTAPTWEVELLISAASLFSLLSLPGILDQAFLEARAYFDASITLLVALGYLYAKVTSYTLIATFSLHLLLRSIWTATVGLRSVFPDGIRWDQVKSGPVFREHAQAHGLDLESSVERADNAATVVFAFGILLACMSLSIMIGSLLVAALSALISNVAFAGHEPPGWILLALLAVFIAPPVWASLHDRHFSARLRPGSRSYRLIQVCYRFLHRSGAGSVLHPIMLTLASQTGAKRFGIVFSAALYAIMAVVSVQMFALSGRLDISASRDLPDIQDTQLRSQHYATSRSLGERFSNTPFIQAEVITEPYLRLFIPYSEVRLAAAMQAHCPEQLRVIADDADEAARYEAAQHYLRCAGALFAPALNDQALTSLRLDVATDQKTELRGFVAFIDVRALPEGRHVLKLRNLPKPDSPTSRQDPEWFWIPFYR